MSSSHHHVPNNNPTPHESLCLSLKGGCRGYTGWEMDGRNRASSACRVYCSTCISVRITIENILEEVNGTRKARKLKSSHAGTS